MGWRAGFSRVDITPPPGSVTKSVRSPGTGTIDVSWIPLTARVAIIEDESTRCVIVALDLAAISRFTADRLRSMVAARAHTDPSNVLISCSHTHNGVLTVSIFGDEPDLLFLERIEGYVLTAFTLAEADLGPVGITAGSAMTSDLTFNRRPVYDDDQVGTHGGSSRFVVITAC
jgi:hypothetical protein